MSILGVLSLCFLVYIKKRLHSDKLIFSSMALILLQLVFAFWDVFNILGGRKPNITLSFVYIIITLAVIFTLSIFVNLSIYKFNKGLIVITLLLVLYTEYFNGIYSFSKIPDFFRFSLRLKTYYYIVPYKVTQGRTYSLDGEATVHYLNLFHPTDIKSGTNGELYYYESRESYDKWFRFGIPEGQQIL